MFKSIVILQRPGDETVTGKWILDDILQFGKQNNIPISFYNGAYFHEVDEELLFVAIGGDGTMLRAMDVSLTHNTTISDTSSVVGFNAGNLGFLTEDPAFIQPQTMLTRILNSSELVVCEERMAVSTIIDGVEHFAINEFVFSAGNISAPLNYTITINEKLVAEHMGSGCMVATATGSTAMSMSGGGAIISPFTKVMQIVPIIPHTLTSRPVITSGSDVITISSTMDRVDVVVILSDGRELHQFKEDASVEITAAKLPIRVWYETKREFFHVLSTKLKW